MMRILGLDPGSRFTGFGCIDYRAASSQLVDQGRIACAARFPLPQRLAQLVAELEILLDRWQPTVAVLETPFHGVNSRSLIVLAQARGALLATLALRQVPIEELSPAEVKSAVTGNGRADKQQVTRMVGMLLRGAQGASEDAADALAVALGFAARLPLRQATLRLAGRDPTSNPAPESNR